MKHIKALAEGFVVKELFITLAVLLVLFAIAFPAYRDYRQRNYYKDVVDATIPLKIAVAKCYKKLKTFTGCNSGSYSIPHPIKKPEDAIASITVINGVITATPVAKDGIVATDTYILTPQIVNDELTWIPSGDGLTHGFTG